MVLHLVFIVIYVYLRMYTHIPHEFIFYSVLVSVSCPKALFHLESDNLFRITVVVADWLD